MAESDELTVAMEQLGQLAPLELSGIDASRRWDIVLQMSPARTRHDLLDYVFVYLINARLLACDLRVASRFGKAQTIQFGKATDPSTGAPTDTLHITADAGTFSAAFGRILVTETSLKASVRT